MLRKFLVRNFVLCTIKERTLLQVFNTIFFIPAFVGILILAPSSLILSSLAVIILLGQFLPLKKKEWKRPRASRIMYPYFLAMGITFGLSLPVIPWVLLGGWVILCWIGFNGYKIGYFDLFKVKYEELDEEQKAQYDELPGWVKV